MHGTSRRRIVAKTNKPQPRVPDAKFETGPQPDAALYSGAGQLSPGFQPQPGDFAGGNPAERPVANWAAGEVDLSTLGTTGLKQYGGFVDEEWSPFLRNLFKIKVFREMEDNSSAVGAIRFLLRVLLSQVEWYMEPPKALADSREAREVCEFVEECRLDMSHSWFDFVSEGHSFLTYGFTPFEEVYKVRGGKDAKVWDARRGAMVKDGSRWSRYDDNRLGWRKLAVRAQETLLRWEFDQYDRSLLGAHFWDPYAGRGSFVPIEKMLLLRTEVTRGNPEGRSLYRSAFRDYRILKRVEEVEAIGVNKDLTGSFILRLPIELLAQDASAANKALRATIEKGVARLQRDEFNYVTMPPKVTADNKPTGYELERIMSAGQHSVDTGKLKNYYRTGILQSCLAQFLQLGQQDMGGNRALSSDHTDLFALGLYTMVSAMIEPFNRYAITRLLEANDIDIELAPVLRHGDIESPPLEEVSKYLVNLATAGVPFQSRELTDKLMELASLPKPSPEDIMANEQANAAASAPDGQEQQKQNEDSPDDPGGAQAKSSAKQQDDLRQVRKWLLKRHQKVFPRRPQ